MDEKLFEEFRNQIEIHYLICGYEEQHYFNQEFKVDGE